MEEDLTRGLLETVDIESYRAEKRAAMHIMLDDADGEIGPVPTDGGGAKSEPELDRLSSILHRFNEAYGDIEWSEDDRVKIAKLIAEDLPILVKADEAFLNAMQISQRTCRCFNWVLAIWKFS